MTYTPTIYDWRYLCAPIDQVLIAGGSAGNGLMTLGGVTHSNPEPGGNAFLKMNFSKFATEAANLDASWTISRITSGTVMRVPLYKSVQLVSADVLGLDPDGQPWANQEPWSSGYNWAFGPFAPVASSAAQGAITCSVDLADYGEIIKIGHVIGFTEDGYDFAHVVMDVEYTDDVAEITVSPPLRRALTTESRMEFRPKVLVQCKNAQEVAGTFERGRHMQFNAAHFVEFIV